MKGNFEVSSFDVKEFDRILDCGLSHGLGERGGQVCIEAAICQVLNLPHGDDPGCVAASVRALKIRLNDSRWSSPKARAAGLRDLGLAQLGSKGTVDNKQFAMLLSERTIRVLLPTMIRDLFPANEKLIAAALVCEQEGTEQSARALQKAAYAAAAASSSAAYAAAAAASSSAAYAAAAASSSAAYAAAAADAAYAAADKYLRLEASIALEILRELKSPGVVLLDEAA
jgi:hypothetical protein